VLASAEETVQRAHRAAEAAELCANAYPPVPAIAATDAFTSVVNATTAKREVDPNAEGPNNMIVRSPAMSRLVPVSKSWKAK